MPLWCQNDPIVKFTYLPPHPHPSPPQHALIRIVTRAVFNTERTATDPDDVVYLELLAPLSVRTNIIQEKIDPLLPQEFEIDDETNLEVIHTPSTIVGKSMLADAFAARCELFIELSDSLDPALNPLIDEIRILVYDRNKSLLTDHVFSAAVAAADPDTPSDTCTLRFLAQFDNDGTDHTDEIKRQHPPTPNTSTWS